MAEQPLTPQQVMQRQQQELQRQIQQAKARDAEQFGHTGNEATPAAPVLGGALGQQAAPAASAPAAAAQPAPAQQTIGQVPSGQTAAQLAAGLPQQNPQAPTIAQLQAQIAALQGQQAAQPVYAQPQPAPRPQPQVVAQPAGSQFEQHKPKAAPAKPVVRWHPGRNSDIKIELQDVVIAGIPEMVTSEPDPQAKVVAALFSEILALRQRIAQLEAGGVAQAGPMEVSIPAEFEMRVMKLEMTLMQQTQALSQSARAMREEAQRQIIAEQQANMGQPGGTPAVDPSKAQVDPAAAAAAGVKAEPAPEGPTGPSEEGSAPIGANGPAGA